jgi:hypothetical protein
MLSQRRRSLHPQDQPLKVVPTHRRPASRATSSTTQPMVTQRRETPRCPNFLPKFRFFFSAFFIFVLKFRTGTRGLRLKELLMVQAHLLGCFSFFSSFPCLFLMVLRDLTVSKIEHISTYEHFQNQTFLRT